MSKPRKICLMTCKSFVCLRRKGHDGKHIARGQGGVIRATWQRFNEFKLAPWPELDNPKKER